MQLAAINYKVVNLQNTGPIFHRLRQVLQQLQSDIHNSIHSAQGCPTPSITGIILPGFGVLKGVVELG